jgi:hypothetical protein
MKWIRRYLIIFVILIVIISGCHFPFQDQKAPVSDEVQDIGSEKPVSESQPDTIDIDPSEVQIGTGDIPQGALSPEALTYLGAFRLPDEPDNLNWLYSGQGLTYYPEGDPQGEDDGFPGSLFFIGHDQELLVAEISIPVPMQAGNFDDLNIAQVIQPFADITNGYVTDDREIPVMDIAYLPAPPGQADDKLHFTVGHHFQDFEPSHGWVSLDLSEPDTAGLWLLDGYTNYVTNDYLFDIPHDWALAYVNGYLLATGRFREGVWGGFGPALFAYAPWREDDQPRPGQTLTAIQPLLLYGIQIEGSPDIQTDDAMRMEGYGEADHWWGGAWLTSSEGDAVIFTGTKALGENWYGFANGVVWDYDCAEDPDNPCPEVPDFPYDNRGYWAEDFLPAVLFFNPADLAKVAQGEMEPYEPQPYALLNLSEYWLDPETNLETYKRDLVGAAAFDRENGLLYIVERLAYDSQSVIHVFQISGN